MNLEISIPLDEDGFIEMECDFCKNRFMLHQDVYSDESNLHFFCPICGLPNQINTFYCSEVLEAIEQKVLNYAYEEIDKHLSRAFKGFNKNGLIKMSVKKQHKALEKELYQPINKYIKTHADCCKIDIKLLEFDAEIGTYCPICGGTNL